MTLERNLKKEVEAKTKSLKAEQVTLLIGLSAFVLATICACANTIAATYFAIYFCQATKISRLADLANCYWGIGQIATLVNSFYAFAMGVRVYSTKRLQPIVLAPLLGFYFCGALLQHILSLANQHYGFQRMLQAEIVIVVTCILLMIPIIVSLALHLANAIMQRQAQQNN